MVSTMADSSTRIGFTEFGVFDGIGADLAIGEITLFVSQAQPGAVWQWSVQVAGTFIRNGTADDRPDAELAAANAAEAWVVEMLAQVRTLIPAAPAGADPVAKISSLTASREPRMVQQIIIKRYGFTPTLDYCADLIAFIEELTDGQTG